jgi:hypothetical protein
MWGHTVHRLYTLGRAIGGRLHVESHSTSAILPRERSTRPIPGEVIQYTGNSPYREERGSLQVMSYSTLVILPRKRGARAKAGKVIKYAGYAP